MSVRPLIDSLGFGSNSSVSTELSNPSAEPGYFSLRTYLMGPSPEPAPVSGRPLLRMPVNTRTNRVARPIQPAAAPVSAQEAGETEEDPRSFVRLGRQSPGPRPIERSGLFSFTSKEMLGAEAPAARTTPSSTTALVSLNAPSPIQASSHPPDGAAVGFGGFAQPPPTGSGLELVGGSRRSTEVAAEMSLLRDDLSKSQAENADLTSKNASLVSENEGLSQRLDFLSKGENVLKAQVSDLDQKNADLRRNLDSVNARIQSFDAIQEQLVQEQAVSNDLRRAMDVMQDKYNALHDEKVGLEAERTQAQLNRSQEKSEYLRQIKEQKEQLFALNARLEEAERVAAAAQLAAELAAERVAQEAEQVSTPPPSVEKIAEASYFVGTDNETIETGMNTIEALRGAFVSASVDYYGASCDLTGLTYAHDDHANHPMRKMDGTIGGMPLAGFGLTLQPNQKMRNSWSVSYDATQVGAEIGQEAYGPAQRFLKATTEDVAAWISAQKRERVQTKMIAVGL